MVADRKVTVASVLRHAARISGHSEADLVGRPRYRSISATRAAVVWVVRKQSSPPTFPSIGQRIGRDHSTVIHLFHKAEILLERDKAFADLVASIRAATESEPWPMVPARVVRAVVEAVPAPAPAAAELEEADEPAKVWCRQCEALVTAHQARKCASQWCGARYAA